MVARRGFLSLASDKGKKKPPQKQRGTVKWGWVGTGNRCSSAPVTDGPIRALLGDLAFATNFVGTEELYEVTGNFIFSET